MDSYHPMDVFGRWILIEVDLVTLLPSVPSREPRIARWVETNPVAAQLVQPRFQFPDISKLLNPSVLVYAIIVEVPKPGSQVDVSPAICHCLVSRVRAA